MTSPAFAQRWLRRIPAYALLIVCAGVLLFPLYVTVVDSLHTVGELIQNPPPSLWPSDPQWGNYYSDTGAVGTASKSCHLFNNNGLEVAPLTCYLTNSLIMSSVITIGQLITAALAAYAFAFLRFPGRDALFAVFLATMMVPLEVAIIPNFQTVQWLGWTDTYPGLVAPFLATGFGTFLLRQYFLSIPRELHDAAEMDGYGHFRFLWSVVLPLARGALATLAVFAFLQAWNQYLWPLLVTNDADMRTVQIGIAGDTADIQRINTAFAGTIIAFAPMLILVVAFQRYLVRGLFGGAVKG
ncbi:MAG: carbohydrate ABC transporter permease [Dehalococcoidia bacterium]